MIDGAVDSSVSFQVVQLDPAMTVGRSSSSSHHLDASDREASGGCLSKMNIRHSSLSYFIIPFFILLTMDSVPSSVHRHLPQVLVRGDNVVSVYRYRSTYYGKKS